MKTDKENRETSRGPLVSIVVPVYNVRDHIERCLDSILAQTYRNIEVILSLDYPTDGSDKICERYAAQDSRIKLVKAAVNQGPAKARKRGVQAASGEFFGFVDADDFIEPDLYQRLMECRGDFDLVIAQWIREDGPKTRRGYDELPVKAYQTEEEMAFILEHLINVSLPGGNGNLKRGIAVSFWNKLFKAEMTKKLFEVIDEEIRIGEDLEFVYRYILKCRSILITDICGYHYQIHNKSICHSVEQNGQRLKDICSLYLALEPVFAAHPQHDSLLPQLQLKVSATMSFTLVKMGFAPEAQLHLTSLGIKNELEKLQF